MKDIAHTGDMDGVPIVRRRTASERLLEILSKMAPASINNSRKIAINKLKSMEQYPSEAKSQELQDMIDGISIDYGEYASSGGEHDISNPSNEPF